MGKHLIVVDWGTSNFRAWLTDVETVSVIDTIPEGLGMAALKSSDFPVYFAERLEPWRKGNTETQVYMAGMVGAAEGWQKAPQLPVPLTLADLTNQVVPVEGVEGAWIIPGARVDGKDADIMRGEEVQIFGALALSRLEDAVLCMPGTHSKWAQARRGALTGFTTSMTGEMHALLMDHALVGRLAEDNAGFDEEIFEQGIAQAENERGLLHHIFTARSRVLYDDLPPTAVSTYISGILIGSEIAAMTGKYPAYKDEILLVCSEALQEPYACALRRAGYRFEWIDSTTATLNGTAAIVRNHQSG